MSFTFSVGAPEPPDSQAVLFGVNLPDVKRIEPGEVEGPWPEGIVHFFRPGLSTRSVEVSYSDSQVSVRILILSSEEDYDLALRFVESVAMLCGGMIQPEDSDPIPIEELRARYDQAWIRRMNESAAQEVRTLANTMEGYLTLTGPVRPFYFGPRLMEELDDLGPPEEFLDRLHEAMLRVQNVDESRYFVANALELRPNDRSDVSVMAAAWGPDVDYFFPNVDYLILLDEDRKPMFLPVESLPEVVDQGWSWLDERHLLVDSIPEEAWKEVIERARAYVENPFKE